MTRAGRRLVEDFLLPALESGKYGDLLKWIDRDKKCFSIRWSHKNAAKWSLDDTTVFQAWDLLKGHHNPQIKGYYMQAKQRFRAALYKINTVKKLPSEDKHIKKYMFVAHPEKKKTEYLVRSKARMPKNEENQTAIPTSVICKNTSYTGKQNTACSEPASSPSSSIESDESEDKELQKCMEEYSEAQKNQMRARELKEYQNSLKKEESSPMDTSDSDQKESSISPRLPHIPIQPAPSYPRIVHFFENHQRYESPQLMLVKTYNEVRVPDDEDHINDVGCVWIPPPPASQESEADALNLSMKSEYESSSR